MLCSTWISYFCVFICFMIFQNVRSYCISPYFYYSLVHVIWLSFNPSPTVTLWNTHIRFTLCIRNRLYKYIYTIMCKDLETFWYKGQNILTTFKAKTTVSHLILTIASGTVDLNISSCFNIWHVGYYLFIFIPFVMVTLIDKIICNICLYIKRLFICKFVKIHNFIFQLYWFEYKIFWRFLPSVEI